VSYWVCHSAGWPYIAWKSHEMIYALGLPKRYIVWSSVISFPSSLKHSWFLEIESLLIIIDLIYWFVSWVCMVLLIAIE